MRIGGGAGLVEGARPIGGGVARPIVGARPIPGPIVGGDGAGDRDGDGGTTIKGIAIPPIVASDKGKDAKLGR